MKLKFKKQQFQLDVVNAVFDIFEGLGSGSLEYIYEK